MKHLNAWNIKFYHFSQFKQSFVISDDSKFLIYRAAPVYVYIISNTCYTLTDGFSWQRNNDMASLCALSIVLSGCVVHMSGPVLGHCLMSLAVCLFCLCSEGAFLPSSISHTDPEASLWKNKARISCASSVWSFYSSIFSFGIDSLITIMHRASC